MKNYLLVLAVMMAAAPAFASRARLESLGEGKNGSLFIDDSRNMFYNPAAINNYKKKMFLELGLPTEAADTITNSKAQGGFTNTFGDFVYGLYLGNESDRSHSSIASAATGGGLGTTLAFATPENTVDFFIGGDAGTKWGLNLFYSGEESNAGVQKTFSQFGTRLGAMFGQTQVFSTVAIATKAKGATVAADEFKGKIGVDLGATHAMDNMTYFVKGTMTGFELLPAGTKSLEVNKMTAELGMGYKKEVSKSANIFSRVQFGYSTQEIKPVTGAISKVNQLNLPVTLGMEAEALSWLTVRGSVAQSLWGQNTTAGVRTSINNSTQVAAGLGLKFGDIMIDGLVSTLAGAANTDIGSSGSVTGNANGNFGFGDSMLTRVGMTYSF
jgi:hypothetical protein